MISLLEFLNEGKSSPEKQFEEFAQKRVSKFIKGEKRAKYPSCRPTPSQCKQPGKGKK